MSKGDAEHAAQHVHGVQVMPEPPTPQTIEQRVAKLEARAKALEDAFAILEAERGKYLARTKKAD